MFRKVQIAWIGLLLGAVVGALPVAAQAASSIVTITVLAVQHVEGTTSVAVPTDSTHGRGQLIVKSNTPWVLVAHASEAVVGLSWRMAGTATWERLGTTTPVLQGVKGVHQVAYEIRMDPRAPRSNQPIVVTFSVEAFATP